MTSLPIDMADQPTRRGDATSTVEGRHSTRAVAEDALARAKREGLELAVKARWASLAVIALMLPFINPKVEILYYHVLIGLFALIGWAQLKVGSVGWSRWELVLLFCDLLLMTLITVMPNPLSDADWPTAMQYRFGNFIYFFVLLAGGTLAYNWRTVVAMGTWTGGLWCLGVIAVFIWPNAQPELTEAAQRAFASNERVLAVLDPNSLDLGIRLQEIVVFMLVAGMLALTVNRSSRLLLSHAEVERERTNLARYFSPNVVEELSQKDEPLKQVHTQNVAVLFVDIVGFTTFADGRDPNDVIETLREFHGAMEQEVFRHNGTLDKYLGDGLMATFGTPFTGPADAGNALNCSLAMVAAADALNERRRAKGLPSIRASFGLHYGVVVVGDIGANRLEFAVIGSTVNVASRLESMTRPLGCSIVASDALVAQARSEVRMDGSAFTQFDRRPALEIRGIEQPMDAWTFGKPTAGA